MGWTSVSGDGTVILRIGAEGGDGFFQSLGGAEKSLGTGQAFGPEAALLPFVGGVRNDTAYKGAGLDG